MNAKFQSIRRKVKFFFSVFPFFGRNHYERLNSRLDRQIKIREEKRKLINNKIKKKQLFSQVDQEMYLKKINFFDNDKN